LKISDFKLVDSNKHRDRFSRIINDFNATEKPYPAGKPIHELFAEVAARHADKVAVIFRDQRINYDELDKRSNQVAAFLRSNGIGREDVVAILMDTSVELIVAMLGVLKAGGAYVGINKEYPLERIRFILNDTHSRMIISQAVFISHLNRLQWECEKLTAYLVMDADDVYSIPETSNELMRKDLWDFVGEDAKDDIEAGGWISSYTGAPLSREVMTDYAQNVLDKIRPYLGKDKRVLEIGCASGITMFNMLPYVKEYYGTDLSERILEKTAVMAKEQGYNNLKLSCLPAHEIDRLTHGSFDIIIINSVIQCFSGLNYLRDVIGKAITLLDGQGIIFIGDIMDLDSKDAMIESLTAFKKQHNALEYKTKTDWSNELFVSRRFFNDLPLQYPVIEDVAHTGKTAAIESELSRYRYDTIL